MEDDASAASSSNGGVNGGIIVNQRGAMRIENPFTFKVGQVFTGFGVGCGLGIGVGRPLNLGAIPVMNQVMTAASGATHAFSGVARHMNNSLKKIGAKNIEAGIGCGVGFGHGFGVGVALKPGVVLRIQMHIMEAMTKLMMKFGGGPNLSIRQGVLPASMECCMNAVHGSSSQDTLGSVMQFGKNIPDLMNQDSAGSRKVNAIGSSASESAPLNLTYGTRSESLINNFLKDPVLRGEDTREKDGELQSENEVLRMLLKHQQVIEELIEENEQLRQILVEDLKIPPSKLQKGYSGKIRFPCSDCFECRRKERRR